MTRTIPDQPVNRRDRAYTVGYNQALKDLDSLDLDPMRRRQVARIIISHIPFGGPDRRWGYRSAMVDVVNGESVVPR